MSDEKSWYSNDDDSVEERKPESAEGMRSEDTSPVGENPYVNQNPYSTPQQSTYPHPGENPYVAASPQYATPPQAGPYQAPTGYGQGHGTPYQAGYAYQPAPNNGFGITALIMGILALTFSWIPFINILAILLGIGALIFGFVGIRKNGLPKGTAIAGLITGGVALLVSLFITLLLIVAFSADSGYRSDYSNSTYSSGVQEQVQENCESEVSEIV